MLKKLAKFNGVQGPIVIIVLDGYGINPQTVGNAIANARKPMLDSVFAQFPQTLLKAHGTFVGMPSDADMGNSEVGHNAIGSGQVYDQGASLVNDAIASGALFQRQAWKEITANVKDSQKVLHFIGLFSDGNVHSHINHLKAMIKRAKGENVKQVRIHILLDGRDVSETSALDYVNPFEQFLSELNTNSFNAQIASGGGRQYITMDRYEADWSMVERGWHTHALGEGRRFKNAKEAIETYREENPKMIDQDMPAFVIEKDGQALGPIHDGDSVIFFNFRGDRGIEISRAFEEENFTVFNRKRHPKVVFAGMLQYDGDLKIPNRFLVIPPEIKSTMGELLAGNGVTQLAISETQKYGHVTYFWNGNRSGKFDKNLETYIEIESDVVPFEQRPWMKAAEITDELIKQLKTGKHQLLRVNYANGDMVGHTGNFNAAILAIEAVDLALSRLLPVIDAMKGMAIITADHGNADEMFEFDKKSGQPIKSIHGGFKAKTSHTLNPVPCVFYDTHYRDAYHIADLSQRGLGNLASTAVNLLGYEAPELWNPSLLTF